MYLNRNPVPDAPTSRFRHNALDRNQILIDQRGENPSHSALDVADLEGPSVEYLDGVGVVGVEGLADETDHLAAADPAGVILKPHDVSDDEANHVGLVGGRGLRPGVEGHEEVHWVALLVVVHWRGFWSGFCGVEYFFVVFRRGK